MIKFDKKGMSLAEVVIAATVITVFLTALVGLYNLHLKVIFSSARQIKAGFLGEEGQEGIKFLRNISWSINIAPLTTGATYRLAWEGGKWVVISTGGYIDGLYDRTIVFDSVQRDAQSNIVSSGGTVDPNIRKVTVTTSWLERTATSTRVLTTYLVNLFDN
ncbi:MAG: hypothetical protein AAB660_01385 [Patescibacteria group bacterium]